MVDGPLGGVHGAVEVVQGDPGLGAAGEVDDGGAGEVVLPVLAGGGVELGQRASGLGEVEGAGAAQHAQFADYVGAYLSHRSRRYESATAVSGGNMFADSFVYTGMRLGEGASLLTI